MTAEGNILLYTDEQEFIKAEQVKVGIYYVNAEVLLWGYLKTRKQRQAEKNANCANFLFWLLVCFYATCLVICHHYLFNTWQIGTVPDTKYMNDFYI